VLLQGDPIDLDDEPKTIMEVGGANTQMDKDTDFTFAIMFVEFGQIMTPKPSSISRKMHACQLITIIVQSQEERENT